MNTDRMPMMQRSLLAMAAALLCSACATLQPPLPETVAGTPADWPLPPTMHAGEADHVQATADVLDISWRDFFADPRLQSLIEQALLNNRDLRIAALNVERARAQYRIQRSERLPSIFAEGSANRSGGDAATTPDVYSATVGIASFELDLFGRIRNLSDAALRSFLATDQARVATQLALIGEVANAYLTLAADEEQLRIAEATLQSHEASFRLTEQRHQLGAVSTLDLAQARTVVETARADVARFAGRTVRSRNALTLLAGGVVDTGLQPERFSPSTNGLPALPSDLPAQTLLRRPDVIAAELRLQAASANIGAARAAFFPSIRLTGSYGTASDELSGLFESGTDIWTFVPQIRIPIFQGGGLRAALGMAVADRDIALAEYEKSIQTGFLEAADALALSRTLADQRSAQEALVAAATEAHDLSDARYRSGRDSFLVLLDAQRTLYAARQALIETQLAEQTNRITLYKALGGGWPGNPTEAGP